MNIWLKRSLLLFGLILLCITIPVSAVRVNIPGDSGPLLLWSAPTGSTETISENAAKVACSGDGMYIVAGYGTGNIECRDRKGTTLWQWKTPHPYYKVGHIAVSRDGNYTVVMLSDPLQTHPGELEYFNRSGNLLWSWTLHGPFGFGAISGNGSILALVDCDNVEILDSTGKLTGATNLSGSIWHMAVSDDGGTIVVGSDDRNNNRSSLTVMGINGTVLWRARLDHTMEGVAVSSHGDFVIAADSGQLWYFTSRGNRTWSYNSTPQYTGVALSGDGSYVAASSQYLLRFFNKTGALLWKYEAPYLLVPGTTGPYFDAPLISSDGMYIAVNGPDGEVLFFDRNGTLHWKYESPPWIMSTSLSRDGKYLAIGTERDFRYFDTGIEVPPVDAEPAMVATTITPPPATPPNQSPVPEGVVIIGTAAGILFWSNLKREK